jgi:hypothetical protein
MGTVTYVELLNEIQYHLLEDANAGTSYYSAQWTKDEVYFYIRNRQNQFLKDTAILLKRATIAYVAGQLRQPLPDDWVITQRIVWYNDTLPIAGSRMRIDEFPLLPHVIGMAAEDRYRWTSVGLSLPSGAIPGSNSYKELPRSDSWDADYAEQDWNTVTKIMPEVYMDQELPSLEVIIAPVPTNNGYPEILYVYQDPMELTALNSTLRIDEFAPYPRVAGMPIQDRYRWTSVGLSLPIRFTLTTPNDFTPAIKYGVLADMLSKVGRGQDLTRAAYCESRYQEGVEAAKIMLSGWQGG